MIEPAPSFLHLSIGYNTFNLLSMLRFTTIILLLTQATSLHLASRCLSGYDPGHCPCSARASFSPTFCLIPLSSDTCVQTGCETPYVCDCSGTTLCRLYPLSSILRCTNRVKMDGRCTCIREFVNSPGAQSTVLRPLRPLGRTKLLPLRDTFCSERLSFWNRKDASPLLHHAFQLASEAEYVSSARKLRFGRATHSVTFTSPAALQRIAQSPRTGPKFLPFGSVDPLHVPAVPAECIGALLSIRLAKARVATRNEVRVSPFDPASIVFSSCKLLAKDHPAVGMSVERFMENAKMSLSPYPDCNGQMDHLQVWQGCRVLNANFEGCTRDLGCLRAVSPS